ncbi:hypothetical protein JCM30394_13200 [Deferrisoma palaeochoriense]
MVQTAAAHRVAEGEVITPAAKTRSGAWGLLERRAWLLQSLHPALRQRLGLFRPSGLTKRPEFLSRSVHPAECRMQRKPDAALTHCRKQAPCPRDLLARLY